MKRKEFLVIEGIEVYVDPGYLSIEPRIYLVENGRNKTITRSSGEFENNFNEFMLDTSLAGELKIKADKIMTELAKENSIEDFSERGMLKFTLKDKYAKKLTEIKGNLTKKEKDEYLYGRR